jgi:hypothetical protein
VPRELGDEFIVEEINRVFTGAFDFIKKILGAGNLGNIG